MTANTKPTNRYWGDTTPPKSKVEFFDAVTTPAPSGDSTIATIRMYGPIDSWGGWWGISTKDVGQVLDSLPDTVSQIILRINSPGGEVFEGLAILNMLRAHKAKVLAVVDGLAASAASVIAAGADETVMSPGTQMMIHSPWVITWGSAADLRKSADVLDGIEESIIEIYTDKAGERDWPTLLGDDTWLTAAAAVELGLADRIAVIPDAGETETVGTDDLDVGDDDEIENSTPLRPAALGPGLLTAAAAKPPSSTEPGNPEEKEVASMARTFLDEVRDRLGITDAGASEETVLAALDEALEDRATTPAASAVPPIPEGAVVMDGAALQELRDQAALGVQAREEQIAARRDAVVASALSEGRIAASAKDLWRKALDKDEEGTTALLATFPKASAMPTVEKGHTDGVTDADSALYAAAFGDDDEKEA